MRRWLEKNFSARPGPMKIIISPLIGGLNWTTLYKAETRMWLAPPKIDSEQVSQYQKILSAYSIFTELDHSYVNPFTKVIMQNVEKMFADIDDWATKNTGASDYSTPELQFNEYMTWSVYLMYASDRLNDEDFAKLNSAIVKFMSDQRGFKKFSEFNNKALDLYRSRQISAEQVMKTLVSG
jgi:hypothetical protein